LIALDSLRADHLGCAGYDRDTTLELDRLAFEGTRFDSAFSAAPQLLPAHAAILSGCDPSLSRRVFPPGARPTVLSEWTLTERLPLLAREFLRQGWTTGAFIDHPFISPAYGFSQGFQVFRGVKIKPGMRTSDVGIQGTGAKFQQWLAGLGRGEDWFAYLHLNDLVRTWEQRDEQWDEFFEARPELSEVPPIADAAQIFFAIGRGKWSGGMSTIGRLRSRYEGAIARLDRGLGNIFAEMRRTGRWENTTVVVTGSFGLGFGESGLILESGTLSDADLRVPMIVRPAASIRHAKEHVSDLLVSTVDLAPSLLDLLDLAVPRDMDGVSFARTLRGEPELRPREVAFASCGIQPGYAVLDRRYCYERVYPGRVLDERLRQSWYGDIGPHEDDLREVVHDRKADVQSGHLGLGPAAFGVIERMRGVGQAWARETYARRLRIQQAEWAAGDSEGP
jgi:arylsulfatase